MTTTPPKKRIYKKRRSDPTKRLSEQEKLVIAAHLRNGASLRQAARTAGVSPATVHAISHDLELNQRLTLADHVKAGLAADAYLLASQAMSHCVDTMEEAGPYQAAMIGAVMIDKARLVEGASTSNVSIKSTVKHIDARIKELEEELSKD